MENQAHYWRMQDNAIAQPMDTGDGDYERPGKRQREERGRNLSPKRGKGARKIDGQPGQRVSTDRFGQKFCGAFNSSKGCTRNERDCPQRAKHACCFQIEKGRACGRKDHNFLTH